MATATASAVRKAAHTTVEQNETPLTFENDVPSERWSDDALAEYGHKYHVEVTTADEQIATIGKRQITAYLRVGWALSIVQARLALQKGAWTAWQKKHADQFGQLNTISEYIALHTRHEADHGKRAEDCITVADVKRAYGLIDERGHRANRSGKSRNTKPRPIEPSVAVERLDVVHKTLTGIVMGIKAAQRTIDDKHVEALKELRKTVAADLEEIDTTLAAHLAGARHDPKAKAKTKAKKAHDPRYDKDGNVAL